MDKITEATKAFDGVPEYRLDFKPASAPPSNRPPPSTKKTPDEPLYRKKKTPPPEGTPKTEPGFDITTRSKDLLELIKKFDQIYLKNNGALEDEMKKIDAWEKWSQEYPYWAYANDLQFGNTSSFEGVEQYNWDTRDGFDKYLAAHKANVVKTIPKLIGIFNKLEPLRASIDNAVSESDIAALMTKVTTHITSYFSAVKKFKTLPVTRYFGGEIMSLLQQRKKIPFVVWHNTTTDGSQDDMAKLGFVTAKAKRIERDSIYHVIPSYLSKNEIPRGIAEFNWDWDAQKALLKGAPVLVLNFDQMAADNGSLSTKLETQMPERYLLVTYQDIGIELEKDKKTWKTGAAQWPFDINERWTILSKLPNLPTAQNFDYTLTTEMEGIASRVKFVPVPVLTNSYLHSFHSRMASLLKPLPPATLTVISSRQKVDLAARAEHDRPK
jgi:hypothetical protein